VDNRVLIPRNDTEILVQQALKHIHFSDSLNETIYIDLGTGSACIPISVILEMSPLKFFRSFAGDISNQALEVAEKNTITYLHKESLELIE
jgi:release factor glutamine methyltransferase